MPCSQFTRLIGGQRLVFCVEVFRDLFIFSGDCFHFE